MRSFRILILLALFGACRPKTPAGLDIKGIAPGFKAGTCIITNSDEVDVYGENIDDGKFRLRIQDVKPGYYTLKIRNADRSDTIKPCEIYLENGNYSIEIDAKKLYKYPKITSPSSLQNQLTAFHTLSDELKGNIEAKIDSVNQVLKKQGDNLPPAKYNELLNKLSIAETNLRTADASVLKEFIKKYPKNGISLKLMDDLHYAGDPLDFYPIFKTLPASIRNSQRGKTIDSILSHLVRLVPGAKCPEIDGATADGKPFTLSLLTEQLILVEFWQPNSETNLIKHNELVTALKGIKNFELLSVAFNVDEGKWQRSIQSDKSMPFKILNINGDGSVDLSNWMLLPPKYYLINNKGTILKDDLYFNDIPLNINTALKNSPGDKR